MVRAIKQSVRVQRGGRVELVSAELPEGALTEIIVLLPEPNAEIENAIGIFADDATILDEIVSEAMAARETPLRLGRG